MKYYIIRKVHVVDNLVEYTPIGYVSTNDDAQYIHDVESVSSAGQWIYDNIADLKSGGMSPTEFFSIIDHFYISGWETHNVDNMNLSEIVDLNNPEGI